MKKLNMVFVLFSVVLFFLVSAPSGFSQNFDLEINQSDITEMEGHFDLPIFDTSYQDDTVCQEAKGVLYVINASPYCLDIYLDDIKQYDNLPAGYSLTLWGVTQGTHEFSAMECNGGSSIASWGPKTYEQNKFSVIKILYH